MACIYCQTLPEYFDEINMSVEQNEPRQPRRKMHHHLMRGFTLLEVIVVVFIIGLMATFASLSVGGGDRYLQQEAQRLTGLVQLAAEEAIINAQGYGLEFNKLGYQFGLIGNEGKMTPLEDDDGVFRARTMPDGIFIELEIEGKEIFLQEASSEQEEDSEQKSIIYLWSSGEMTPFLAEFRTEEREGYRVQGDFIGNITYLGRAEE